MRSTLALVQALHVRHDLHVGVELRDGTWSRSRPSACPRGSSHGRSAAAGSTRRRRRRRRSRGFPRPRPRDTSRPVSRARPRRAAAPCSSGASPARLAHLGQQDVPRVTLALRVGQLRRRLHGEAEVLPAHEPGVGGLDVRVAELLRAWPPPAPSACRLRSTRRCARSCRAASARPGSRGSRAGSTRRRGCSRRATRLSRARPPGSASRRPRCRRLSSSSETCFVRLRTSAMRSG